MADNYIERRMEDLRSGRLSRRPAGTGESNAALRQHGYIQFKFPPRKVVLISDSAAMADALAPLFTRAGCRVALITSDSSLGDRMAHDCGVRACVAAGRDRSSVAREFVTLLDAWRGIDILIPACIHEDEYAVALSCWQEHMSHYPVVSDYIPRLIHITGHHDAIRSVTTDDRPIRNRIVLTSGDAEAIDMAARTALFICAPSPRPLCGQNIMI